MDGKYKRRTAVERQFRNRKHNLGLAFLRVRGIERVRLHADLVMLARLALALEFANGSVNHSEATSWPMLVSISRFGSS